MRRRTLFSLHSVRVRLTLWNVAVLALVLIGLGVVFSVSIRVAINSAVDHDLSRRARHMQWFFAHAPASRISAMLSGRDLPPPGFPARPGQFGGGPPPSGQGRQEDALLGNMRPRLFDAHGRPVSARDRAWDSGGLQRALKGRYVYSTARDRTDNVRVLSVPLARGGRILAAAQLGNSLTQIYQEQARVTRTLVTLIPLALLIAGLGGAFLTDRALRPVRRIAQTAGRIEAENLSQRLPVTGNDEFADLAETFNGMLSRLQGAFERLEQAYEQERRFTADASHELRTPLTIIKANTSLALTGPLTGPEYRKTIEAVDAAADRMNRIVQDLLLLARSDSGQLRYFLAPTPLAGVLAEAAAAVRGPDQAPIELAVPPSWQVLGDLDALVRLFGNLLENAARHTPPTGRIDVSAEIQGDHVLIQVADTGEGIAAEHLPQLTERFYRVDVARARTEGGTGLGLAICQSLVDAHGGRMEIESALGQGTVVRVMLPRAEDAAPAPFTANPPALAGRGAVPPRASF